ncbi:hypothetical protein D3C75_1183970 [compost metagenome]
MKQIIINKDKLELFEEHVVCLRSDVYSEVDVVAKSIDKVNGGDYFDHLLVDMGMLTKMKEVWYGQRESFTITLNETTVGSVLLS